MPRRLTQEEFIKRAKEIHPELDYSKVKYINSYTHVTVVCPIHGDYLVQPSHIINLGSGCPKCNTGNKFKKLTEEEVIERAKKYFPEYNYDEFKYSGEYNKTYITCNNLHRYLTTPKYLMEGHGCPICGKIQSGLKQRSTTEEFIEKAKKIHGDKYDYSKVNYETSIIPVEIICPKHGPFWKSPTLHLSQKQGCPKCSQSIGEFQIEKYLSENNIKYIKEYPIEYSENKKGKTYIDFYIPDRNIFVEFNGKQHYVPVKYFGGQLSFEKLQNRDNYVKQYCSKNNIQLIIIDNIKNIEESLKILSNDDK